MMQKQRSSLKAIMVFVVVLSSTLILVNPANAGVVLGVEYDDVYLVRLKASQKKVNHTDLLVVDGKQPGIALETFKVDDRWSKSIDELFPKNGNYDHGLADSRMQAYSLIFYQNGKVVLSISPNLLGGDLYASAKGKFQSMSLKQREQFLNLVFLIMARCDQKPLP